MRIADPFSVLTCGGSDPTGGAGVQGDLKTFAAHGAQGLAVVAALTAQNAGGVRAVLGVDPAFVAAQIAAVLDQVRPGAAKTGMLWAPPIVAAVAGALAAGRLPLVADPVLAATAAGAPLSEPGLAAALERHLFPLATLVTPNLDEAGAFLGRPIAPGEAREAAEALRRRFAGPAVLLKGGHAGGEEAVDVLATAGGVIRLRLPRVPTPHGHGSGCALSASIAARLARGEALLDAVSGAKAYVHRALAAAGPLGSGRGPVRHAVPAEGGPAPVVEPA